MIALFDGRYSWKMPNDVQMEVGPAIIRSAAKELYGGDREILVAVEPG